jgi:all-trans-8'-apo-beta-carotenal 15,15'-oxygenase
MNSTDQATFTSNAQGSRNAGRGGRLAAPLWRGLVEDLPREHAFEPLRVTGTLPGDLNGTLFRNGGGHFAAGGERYRHLFDADGAITGVRIEDGKAWGAARMVQTPWLEREAKAGKRLYGGYDSRPVRPLREIFVDRKNAANTSVLLWQGRLFATCEAGKPFEIDRRDLSTLGETDLGGCVAQAFSAHSHYVPNRRCTYNFGLTLGPRTTVDVYALPDDGPPRVLARFRVPGMRFNHDFIVTDRYIVFLFSPMYLSLLKFVFGLEGPVSGSSWKPKEGTEVIIVPIDDPSRVRRFRTDAFFAEHIVNAFDADDTVVFDYIHYASPRGLEGFVGTFSSGHPEEPLASEVRRATLDPARLSLQTQTILSRAVELPRVSPAVTAARHRYSYHVTWSDRGDRLGAFDAIVKHDGQTGREEVYAPGAGQYTNEAIVVPRAPLAGAGAGAGDAEEDAAWLLTLVYDAAVGRSRLDVLDAESPARGPVASCHFDHALPFGFHGLWSRRS